MNKALVIAICALLIAALAVPAAAGKSANGSKVYKISSNAYYEGKSRLVETEAHLTGMFRNAFALFNPCLDTIKVVTSVALYPIEKPLDMVAKSTFKRKPVRKAAPQKIPQPKKPEMPK